MINISCTDINDGIIFECEGHADFASAGKDIVCAGVSALCMALYNKVQELCDEGEAYKAAESISDGSYYTEVHFYEDKWSEVKLREAVSTIMMGMEAIEKLYPNYVQIS